MNKQKLPLKTRLFSGAISGITFALVMVAFDYFSNKPFSITKFLIHFVFFGLAMSFVFSYKYTKEK